MSDLDSGLRRILADLARCGAKCALIGGIAAGARTWPRFTRDVDLAVAVADDRAAEQLVLQLCQQGYRVVAQMEHRDRKRLATVRLSLPPGVVKGVASPGIDLLFASSGIEAELVREAQVERVLSGISVPVARLGHLVALKLLSEDDRRFQDRGDLVELLKRASEQDVALARRSIAMIQKSGFDRSKDLAARLEDFLAIARLPPDPTFIPRPLPPEPPP